MQEKVLRYRNLLLVIAYGGFGCLIRLINLGSKPIWKDEWATIVFSLGHSFLGIPLDRMVEISTLLQPAILDRANLQDVLTHLMGESNHPALFFLVNHLWLKFGSSPGALVNITWARSLGVVFSCTAIALSFYLGKWLFGSAKIGHFCGIAMAFSPFGVYLAQETRHYTLTIIWIMVSIAALVAVVRAYDRGQLPRWSVIMGWIGANTLGVATHYFFVLVLGAQSLMLAWLGLKALRGQGASSLVNRFWQRIYIAIAGTMVGSGVWLPFVGNTQDGDLTSWLNQDAGWGWHLLAPLPRLMAWIMTMVMVLPVENVPLPIAIASGVVLLTVGGMMGFKLWAVLKTQGSLESKTLWGLIAGIVAMMAAIIYLKGVDLTIAPRYSFVLLPMVVWLWGYGLAQLWDGDGQLPTNSAPPERHHDLTLTAPLSSPFKPFKLNSVQGLGRSPRVGARPLVLLVLCLGLGGSVTVAMDGAYQKANRADVVSDRMVSFAPTESAHTAIATIHKTHSQTGEMMALAWEFNHRYPNFKPQFILAHKQEPNVTPALTVAELIRSRPDLKYLWIVNFFDDQTPLLEQCERGTEEKFKASGYSYYPYLCHQNKPISP